eukprot:TRINITY_DN73462_c0_g1_i1.p1 TRINITY_DN73462_c0_g1~~TRINITY_DN73462_c0_g1_i1.p1  ORF type:complete len:185 (-),score=48.47 TRINITY_DN73462_c0_g1_i1:136-690(-)
MAEAQQPVTMEVAVPDGVAPGMAFNVTTPDNQVLQLTCPEGVGPGMPIQFSYYPLDGQGQAASPALDDTGVEAHPDDVAQRQLNEESAKLIAARQEELLANCAQAYPPSAEVEFAGNAFQPAMFAAGQDAIVTRSSGEESGCNIYEVFLTALGPQYNVYLGQDEAGENIFKWCSESDLRAYPTA